MSNRRVVITGLGMVTSLGNTVASTWDGILAGRSGVGLITDFDASQLPTQIGAAVKDFPVETYMPLKEARRVDGFIQYGLAAAKQALDDSGLTINETNAERIGVAVGSGIGGLGTIESTHISLLEQGARKVSPFFVPASVINMAAGQIAIALGMKGPNLAMATACTTGTHSIGLAARLIAYGDADVMLAGGTEKAICHMGVAAFGAARALSTRNDAPTQASRPFDRDRDGFVMGDGAGVLVLETLESAQARDAHIYAEVVGFGMSDDAFHITSPSEGGEGAALAMRNALRDAKLAPEQVDYINAHGTSTSAGDVAESVAIERVFGDHAGRLAVSSTKSMIGHLLGAAGGVEAIFSVLALRDQVLPPTINLDNPDPQCRLDYVPHTARDARVEVAVSNSFGFGGTNGSLVFKRWR